MYELKKKKYIPLCPVRLPTRQCTKLACCLPGRSVRQTLCETDALWDLKRRFVVKLNCGGFASAQLLFLARPGSRASVDDVCQKRLTEFGENRWGTRRPGTPAAFHPTCKTQKNLVLSHNLPVCWFPWQSCVCAACVNKIEINVCQPLNNPSD